MKIWNRCLQFIWIWTEYLQTMLSGKVERYEVRYKIGTADTAGSAGAAPAPASAATRGGASASPARARGRRHC